MRKTMGNPIKNPTLHGSQNESGKIGTRKRNKDALGPVSDPMGKEDARKDKYGSKHNQDPLGIPSTSTAENRQEMTAVRAKLKGRHRNGSR